MKQFPSSYGIVKFRSADDLSMELRRIVMKIGSTLPDMQELMSRRNERWRGWKSDLSTRFDIGEERRELPVLSPFSSKLLLFVFRCICLTGDL